MLKIVAMIMLHFGCSCIGFPQDNFWYRTKGLNGGVINVVYTDSAGHQFAGGPSGLWSSINNGESWDYIGLYGTGFVSALFVSSQNHLLAGTWGPGVFKTTDNGQSWTNVVLGGSITNFAANTSGDIFAATASRILKSADDGNNWESLSLSGYISGIAINPKGDLFASILYTGIFRSTDNGNTWLQVSNGLTSNVEFCIVTKPNGLVFTGTDGNGVFRSTDDGDHWSQLNSDLSNLRVLQLKVTKEGDLIAGTSGGVFRSTDNGDHWVLIGSEISTVSDLCFNSHGDIFVGTGSFGVYRTTDMGLNWDNVGLPVLGVFALAISPDNSILAGGNGLFQSSDDGQHWIDLSAPNATIRGLAVDSGGVLYEASTAGIFSHSPTGIRWHGCLALDPMYNSVVNALAINHSGTMFAGIFGHGQGVYRSKNQCGNWTQVNNGLLNSSIYAVSVDSGDVIYAGTASGAYRSTNDGDNWILMPLDTSIVSVYSFLFTQYSRVFCGTSKGIYLSTNGGNTWLQDGLITASVYSLSLASSGAIFSGTSQGAYRSTDQGVSWDTVNSGLQDLNIYAMMVDRSGHLLAGTSNGLFRSLQAFTSVGGNINAFLSTYSLDQNYPNPFNPATIISFSLPRHDFVYLDVFNLLGEKIATLVSAELTGGVHKVEWNPTGVASGVYFYRLRAGSFSATKKLVLLR
jgi:photosystem II stability/assembly factor-like uncharacterized protein